MFSFNNSNLSCQYFSNLSTYHHLTELNLSNYQLTKIDYFPFEYFPNIRILDLSYNQLIFINPDWSKTFENSIQYLNLSHNKLQTLLFLKDFKYLKTLNITKNLIEENERILLLDICPTIEHLIDNNQEQIEYDRMKFKQLIEIINENKSKHEKDKILFQLQISPLGNYFLEKQMNKSYVEYENLTKDFNRNMKIENEFKYSFQPMKYLRAHHQSNDDLINTSIHMCAFEPNTTRQILATCGGTKVCLVDCYTCEITHLFQVSTLRSSINSMNRKMKQKINVKEYFSCLCWMEIENMKILAVGATNGHIYLLLPSENLMFGHIELLNSSINCLVWHVNDPFILVIGSYHTIRLINIRTYINRLEIFHRKLIQSSIRFDYVDSSMFIPKISTTHLYNLYDGDGPLITITDLLFYQSLLVVGTTSGIFIIKNNEQSPMQLPLPKSIWTMSTYIESLRSISSSSPLIIMSILHLDQIYCFDLEQSLEKQELHIIFTLPNLTRKIPTKIGLFTDNNVNEIFECLIGNNDGSFSYHQITPTYKKQLTFSWSQMDSIHSPSILSVCLNDQYLCLTTNNNLICIYRRS